MRGRAALATTGAVVGGMFAAKRQRTWGATCKEASEHLPGDDLLAEATQGTRAITIEAPLEEVWAWIVQLGGDRGGFYSYDWLENHFGFVMGAPANLGIHSADHINPGWQERAVGDLVASDAYGLGGWYVVAIEPPYAMVLQMADVKKGRPARIDRPPFMEFSWAFVLSELPEGGTRLLVRERVNGRTGGLAAIVRRVFGLVSFVMTRRMLIGIKQRAEAVTDERGIVIL